MVRPRMRPRLLALAACHALLLGLGLALSLALPGCDQTDPYTRPGEWHPLGANAANLRAMVANPGDLYRGGDDPTSPGDIAAAAVARLREGRVRPLPSSGVSDFKTGTSDVPSDNGGASPAAAGAAAGAGLLP